MKVLMLNGSPHEKGCTYTALSEVAAELEKCGIESQIFWVGVKPVSGCIACGMCHKAGVGCAINDGVNEYAELAENADGFVFGSPVYYAAANGTLTSFMDRLFYSHGKEFYLKPAASVASARRAGNVTTFDQLNKYFAITQMPIITSQYWNTVFGSTPDQVRQDGEGMQTMRVLARNMAWFLRCKEAGAAAGVPFPETENKIRTNFIR